MTNTTIDLALVNGNNVMMMGPNQEIGITKIEGLESSEIDVGMSDLALVDGSSVDGVHIKARPIHIEGSFRRSIDTYEARERLVRFFNPKEKGKLEVNIWHNGELERARSIEWMLEGWTIKKYKNLNSRVGFMADLICPDPYFRGLEKSINCSASKNLVVTNDGDVPTGWTVEANGPTTMLAISNGSDYMRTSIVSKAGDNLVISTVPRSKTVALNGASKFSALDRESLPWKIPVGTSTVILSETFAGRLYYSERFFGI